MRAASQRPGGYGLEWNADAIVLRAALAASVVLFFIGAVALQDAHKDAFAILPAGCAIAFLYLLVRWRTVLSRVQLWRLRVGREMEKREASILISLEAARLAQRASRLRRTRLKEVLLKLKRTRFYLERDSYAFDQLKRYTNGMGVFIVRGDEEPIATVVFSEAMKALGVQVGTYEYSPSGIDQMMRRLAYLSRAAIIVAHGADEASIRDLLHLPDWHGDATIISLFAISQTGEGLFPGAPDTLHDQLKVYLRLAASLAKRPYDNQFELLNPSFHYH